MTASAVLKTNRVVDLRPALSWVCPWDGRENFLPAERIASVQCSCCGRFFPVRETATIAAA